MFGKRKKTEKNVAAPGWEYCWFDEQSKGTEGRREFADGLNTLGDNGWEAVSVACPGNKPLRRILLKRQLIRG